MRSIKQKQREEEHKDELFTFVNCTFSSFCVFGGSGGGFDSPSQPPEDASVVLEVERGCGFVAGSVDWLVS